MQIFVPNGTSLDNESGGIAKTVPAPINYAQRRIQHRSARARDRVEHATELYAIQR